ncbi:MAG: threonine synthase [Gemmatimonadetes bacterium]|nr:threonine synthase [Gemmatimonadota bacterium]
MRETTERAVAGTSHLECTGCGQAWESEKLMGVSPCCTKPLFARYDLERVYPCFRPEGLRGRRPDLWRYEEVLPVRDVSCRAHLGEGFTPLVDATRLAARLGVGRVWIKDEGQNPTGSFKDRGASVAVARAKELGATEVAIPTIGNGGAAAAAYGAALDVAVHVFLPRDTPPATHEQIRALGAELHLLDGNVANSRQAVREGVRQHGWFDLSTLEEPYRVEGKKTMGYEVVEQLGFRLPDVIVYPTGGGTGFIGMWKAFDEMERLGWIGPERPRMVVVQATGCQPIVRAWEQGAETAEPWGEVRTYAAGFGATRVFADFLILRIIRASGGAAVAVPDEAMARWVEIVGKDTGLFISPEGGATLAAVECLRERGLVSEDDEVVAFATASGLKYVGLRPL